MINRALDLVHGGLIFGRRVRVLAETLARQMPPRARILDVGAGDGSMGRAISRLRPDVSVFGIDVFVRPDTAYEVKPFDGERIPYDDSSFDVAVFVDVLHHTKDPLTLLLEAARVARVVVIKDHLRAGLLAEETLSAMDWVGNARHGVVLPYNYWNRLQWDAAFERAGVVVDSWETQLGLYPPPLGLLFDRSLHFVARLRRR
ncbi:MAG: class I SAM-dependent methyltransferase [Deltaproteobacteria bacterium]|nr:class I SAM-dependent methyltransferase [Deltaproteobacteria bacterium]